MTLSVVLPNYNHGALIARALGALTAQILAGSEIIVVDDGSTDDSVKVIEELQTRHPSIRLIRHDVNRGVSAAIRTALAAATGDYLFFSSADDFILPNLLSRAILALSESPEAAFFCSSVAVFNEQDKIIGFRPAMLPRATAGYVSPTDVRQVLREADNFVVGTSVVHRRKCLASIGYFDETLGSLCDGMAYRLLALRHGFCFDPEVLASYRVSSESYSARSSLSAVESGHLVDTAIHWIKQHFPEDLRDQYALQFDRRLRFSMGRLWIVWRKSALDTHAMAKVMNLTFFDSAVMKILSNVPFVSSTFILAWTSIRMRPYGLWALIKGFLHSRKYNRPQSAEIERLLSAARSP
jgi:glycosyltransferase involved in cell wall biosynthesis